MYKLTYNHTYAVTTFKSFDLLADELNDYLSPKIINEVAQALEVSDSYRNAFFEIKHYVNYFYEGRSYSSLYDLAEDIAKEVDEETKVEWFIQNVGICARKDSGDEIELPWDDMIYDDYDHREYDGILADEIDNSVADEIENALFEIAPEKGSFVFSFWESDFTIEVEEEDCFDMADGDENDDYEEEDD